MNRTGIRDYENPHRLSKFVPGHSIQENDSRKFPIWEPASEMNKGLNKWNSLKLNQNISAGPVSMAVACELQFQWKSVILKVKAMRLKVKMNRCYLMLPNVVCFAQRKKGWKIPKKMPISHLGTEAPGKSVVRYWGQAPRGGNSTWVNVPFLSRFCHVFL